MSFLDRLHTSDPIATPADYTGTLQRLGIQPLRNLAAGTLATLLGVVAQLFPATPTTGTDHKLVVRLADPSLGVGETVTWMTFRELHRMPAIRNVGDIVYLEDVKVQEFNGRPQLLSNYATRCEIIPMDIDHPLLQYLRAGGGGQSGGVDAVDYLKRICDLDDHTRYADLLVEVLHVRPADPTDPYIRSAVRLLVTDYTDNKHLHDVPDIVTHPHVSGKRLLWCTINNPDEIPGLPELLPNHFYRLRGAKITIDRFEGLTAVVERHDKFPKTRMVNEVAEGLPELKSLVKKRQKCLSGLTPEALTRPMVIDTTIPQPVAAISAYTPASSILPSALPRTTPRANQSPSVIRPKIQQPPPVLLSEFMSAETTRISDITSNHQATAQRYHIRAQVVDVYPHSAELAIVGSDIRVVLEVADDSGSCLVLCQGAAAAELLGRRSPSMGDTLTALLPLWDLEEEERWIDLCVASVLMPGPEAEGRALLVRCLVLAGGVL